MSYTPPDVAQLLEQQETYFEQALTAWAQRKGIDASPEAIARAVRSPHGLISIFARDNAMLLSGVHQHITWATKQWFVDTAVTRYVLQHAGVWGIVQRPATRAIGRGVIDKAQVNLPIPADLEARVPGGGFVTVAKPVVVGSDGTAIVNLIAVDAGPGANAPGGTKLPLITALPGLTDQSITLDDDGLAGGAVAETTLDLAGRVLQRIQQPPHGGAAFDYPTWITNDHAASHVAVLSSPTPGIVRVCVAMGTRAKPRAPTPAEIEAMYDTIGRYNVSEGERPVTAEVYLIGARIVPVNHRVEVNPDRTDVRAAVGAAISTFYAEDAEIGGTIWFSRLSEAISAANGEYHHRLWSPAADVPMAEIDLAVPGSLDWGAP